ncbi:hypothetical protein TrVE_jg10973 [Triparma verrucosa]|uniref:Uncharacterized protein n=1 Tax=Triparma verrucosa TaxID=1606542 RepID=A0A9W7FN55_9STRA|nr:hypothetical protein TrVE_jg10973 [Triparma verrucosa]
MGLCCIFLLLLLLCIPSNGYILAHIPQVVTCKDIRTKSKVILVGSVHFNPASIALARKTVATEENLGAVVVESCEARWKRSLEVSPEGSFLGDVLPSEMQAAALVAKDRGVPLSLGDVDINDFSPRLKVILKETLADLFSPAGWGRIAKDVQRGASLAFDTTTLADSLQPTDFIRSDVLLGFAVSLIRYPIAAALKAPVPFAIFAIFATSMTLGSTQLDSAIANAEASGDANLALTIALSIFNVLLPIVFARLLLVGFLEERNVRLARSISEAAERGNVIAILGGLHVNGVAKLLESEDALTGDGGGDKKAGTWWTEEMINKI